MNRIPSSHMHHDPSGETMNAQLPARRPWYAVIAPCSIAVYATLVSMLATVLCHVAAGAGLYLRPSVTSLACPATSAQAAALDGLVASPATDTDGDGYTDLQELIAGSAMDDGGATPAKINLALALANGRTADNVTIPAGTGLPVAGANGTPDFDEYLAMLPAAPTAVPTVYPSLSPTVEATFEPELAALAHSLEFSPVRIFEWVYNNIEFEDYELSRKGAYATFLTRRGNEWDQCSLLVALLRLSGVPARYVAGHYYMSAGVPLELQTDQYRWTRTTRATYVLEKTGGGDPGIPPDVARLEVDGSVLTQPVGDAIPTDGQYARSKVAPAEGPCFWSLELRLTGDTDPNGATSIRLYMSYKKVVLVQAWLSVSPEHRNAQPGLTAPARQWVALAPWCKQYDVRPGVDLFHVTDAESRLVPTVPTDLDVPYDYLTYTGSDLSFDAHTQLDAVEYFESAVQEYLGTQPGSHALADVPRLAAIRREALGVLAPGLPMDLAVCVLSGAASDATCDSPPTADQACFDLEIRRATLATPAPLQPIAAFAGAQIAGRRLTLDFIEPVSNRLRPRLLLDGAPLCAAPADTGAWFDKPASPTVPLTSANAFQVYFRWHFSGDSLYATPLVRPAIRAGAIMSISVDSLAASPAAVAQLKTEIEDRNATDALSTDTAVREGYLGRCAVLLSETFNSRFAEDTRRIDALMNVTRLHADATHNLTLIWTYPGDPTGVTAAQLENASALGLAAGWRIDATYTLASAYQPDSPLTTCTDMTSPLGHLAAMLVGGAGSYNEARIFEDWQGTPALSTVAGFFLAIADANGTGNQLAVFGPGTPEATISSALNAAPPGLQIPSTAKTAIVSDVAAGATVITPTQVCQILYPGDSDLAGQVAVQSDVRLTDNPASIGWTFGQFNGGKSDKAKDAAAWNIRTQAPFTNAAARTVHTAGDPIDLVTGEFYLDEPADLAAKTRGRLMFGVARSYRSQLEYNGPFGYGWAWSHADSLTVRSTERFLLCTATRQPIAFSKPWLAKAFTFTPANTGLRKPASIAGGEFDFENLYAGQRIVIANGSSATPDNETAFTIASIETEPGKATLYLDETTLAGSGALNVILALEDLRSGAGKTLTFTPAGASLASIAAGDADAMKHFKAGDTVRVLGGANNNKTAVIDSFSANRFTAYLKSGNAIVAQSGGAILVRDEILPPPGVTLTLAAETDPLTPAAWRVTTPDGAETGFDADGFLVHKADSDGNRLTFEYDAQDRLIAIHDPVNRVLNLTYGAPGSGAEYHVVQVADFTGRCVRYEYDARGDLTAFIDALENTWHYAYLHDQENPLNNHNLGRQTLPDGDWLDIGYYKNDTVSRHTRTDGATFNFQYSWYNRYAETWNEEGFYRKVFYNPNWDVIRVESEDGTLELSEYDAAHNLTAHTDDNGCKTTYTYDASRNLTSIRDPLDHTWFYKWETIAGRFNRQTAQIDPNGVLGQFYYDSLGRLARAEAAVRKGVTGAVTADTKEVLWSGGTPCTFASTGNVERGTVEFDYDAFGNLSAKRQYLAASPGAHLTTTLAYDLDGIGLVRTVDPNGNTTHYLYDDLRRVVAVTDPAGYVTQAEYNAADLPVRKVSPDGAVTELEYDANRRPVRTIAPNGAISELVYGSPFYTDHKDRVLAEIDALGRRVDHEYDARGLRTATADRNGNLTEFFYDAAGRLVETVDALGNSTRVRRDGNGNIVESIDPRGNVTRFVFDAANRPTLQYEAWGARRAVQTEYDDYGNATRVSRGTCNSTGAFSALDWTDFIYDARGHRTREVRNAGSAYPAERRVTETDYDALGRVTEVREGDGSSFLRRTTFAYDVNGNKTATTVYAWENSAWVAQQTSSATYDSRNLTATATDPLGRGATFFHDAAGRTTGERRAYTDGANTQLWQWKQNVFDVMGDPVRTRTFVSAEADGRTSSQTLTGESFFSYDLLRRQTTATDALGNTTAYVYDPNGNRVAVVAPSGSTPPTSNHEPPTTYTWYDALNRPIAARDALGNCAWTEYDAAGNVTAVIDALGNRTLREYADGNHLTAQTDPLGSRTTFAYDSRGRQETVTDPRNHTTTTAYDNLDQPIALSTTVTVYNSNGTTTPNTPVTTTTAYDALGRASLVTDPRNTQTETRYNVLDKPVMVIQARGRDEQTVTRYEYDAAGQLLREKRGLDNEYDDIPVSTDAKVITAYEYDALGRKVRATVGVGMTGALATNWAFLDRQHTLVETSPYGVTATTVFDLLGRKVQAIDAAGNTTTFAYDSRGNLVQTTPPAGVPDAPVTYTYDALNRRPSTTQAGATAYTAYDELGRVSAELDLKGIATLHYYDAAGRQVMTVAAADTADEATTKFQYDANGNLLKVIDANHTNATTLGVADSEVAITTYAYDELNRRWKETDPDANYQTVTYDAAGNPVETRLRSGRVITRVFDALNRVTDVREGATSLQEFGYDRQSRMTFATDYNADVPSGERRTHTVEFTYDFAGRTTHEAQSDEVYSGSRGLGPLGPRHVNTAYSAPGTAGSGLSLKVTQTWPSGGRVWERRSDTAGRLCGIKDMSTNNLATEWTTFDGLNRPGAESAFNTTGAGVLSTGFTYDARGRESSRVTAATAGGATLFGGLTGYDANGNIASEQLSGTAVPAAAGATRSLGYTHDDLDRLTLQDRPAGETDPVWQYDPVGNWTYTNEYWGGETRTVNAENEYTSLAQGTPQYDACGNLTSLTFTPGSPQRFVYDWANRLILVTDALNHLVAAYTYDALNRRITTKRASGVVTTWAYDGANLVQEYTYTTLVRTWLYGAGIDQPEVMIAEPSGARYYYLRDRRNSVVALANAAGAIVESYDYTPFGIMTMRNASGAVITNSACSNPFGFTGRQWDAESRLWYYRNRMYSPVLGRFLQRDPSGFVDGYNLYAYVTNNPLRFTDPMGLDPQTVMNVGIFFDGTCNRKGFPRQFGADTNVAILSDMYLSAGGRQIYERGVGTAVLNLFGHTFSNPLDLVAGGLMGYGGQARVESAYAQLAAIYRANPGAQINVDVFGFSRGAAETRDFANYVYAHGDPTQWQSRFLLPDRTAGTPPAIRFMGIFDTVPSFGIPGNALDFGLDLEIPSNVGSVRHAIAQNELRPFFPLASVLPYEGYVDPAGRIVERFFPGVHSDEGGGYPDNNLASRQAMDWVASEALAAGAPLGPVPAAAYQDNGGPLYHDSRYFPDKVRNLLQSAVGLTPHRAVNYYPHSTGRQVLDWVTLPLAALQMVATLGGELAAAVPRSILGAVGLDAKAWASALPSYPHQALDTQSYQSVAPDSDGLSRFNQTTLYSGHSLDVDMGTGDVRYQPYGFSVSGGQSAPFSTVRRPAYGRGTMTSMPVPTDTVRGFFK